MDRHVWQRLATVVLVALVVFNISTSSLIGNGGGPGITTIRAKKRVHQLSDLLDQQTAILAGLDISPDWVREQSTADSLICGTVKPDDTTPMGVDEDYSYLVTSNCDKEIPLFFETNKGKTAIKYVNHGEKLYTKTAPLSRLAGQSYRTKKQRQQVDKYASTLRAEQLVGYHKLGL